MAFQDGMEINPLNTYLVNATDEGTITDVTISSRKDMDHVPASGACRFKDISRQMSLLL